jgi:enoyl-CoA hydratase/carnithine racemase
MNDDKSTCALSTDGHIAHIELRRPERLNAFTLSAIHNLSALIDEIAQDQRLRLVTIRGAGRAFSTGVDLKTLPQDGFGSDRIQAWEKMLREIETMDKLVICQIHGFAVGGGLQLALACDIRVCTRAAQMGLPASKEGIIPGLATYRLARYVGLGRAKQLIYLGNLIDAERAEHIGLVDHLIDDATMTVEFNALVESYDAAFSTGGRHAKSLISEAFHTDFDVFLSAYEDAQSKAVDAPDFVEAQAAYRDGREPEWK